MDVVLYRHVNRQQWGLAIHAWTRGTQRGYQFEDGALRAFHQDYCHLLERVTLIPDEARHRRATLTRLLGRDPKTTKRRRRTTPPPKFGFHDQVDLFRDLYPEGFTGEAWTKEKRGGDGGALKRHREPAVRLAQELLSADALDGLLTAEDFNGVMERAGQVLAITDLVSASQRRALAGKDAAAQRRLAAELRELLHGEELTFSARFRRYLSELGPGAGWPLATALLALVHPTEHVCVRPTAFKPQARVSIPHLVHSKTPTASLYEAYRAMATSARDKLREADLSPRDLFDVYDFMWTTLRPKSIKQLEAVADSEGTQAKKASAAA